VNLFLFIDVVDIRHQLHDVLILLHELRILHCYLLTSFFQRDEQLKEGTGNHPWLLDLVVGFLLLQENLVWIIFINEAVLVQDFFQKRRRTWSSLDVIRAAWRAVKRLNPSFRIRWFYCWLLWLLVLLLQLEIKRGLLLMLEEIVNEGSHIILLGLMNGRVLFLLFHHLSLENGEFYIGLGSTWNLSTARRWSLRRRCRPLVIWLALKLNLASVLPALFTGFPAFFPATLDFNFISHYLLF